MGFVRDSGLVKEFGDVGVLVGWEDWGGFLRDGLFCVVGDFS